jgi:hypothetical protein
MDREIILQELAQLEDRVARTQRQIASYRETILRLEQRGRDASWAKLMLRQCEEALALHVSVHGRLVQLLSQDSE